MSAYCIDGKIDGNPTVPSLESMLDAGRFSIQIIKVSASLSATYDQVLLCNKMTALIVDDLFSNSLLN